MKLKVFTSSETLSYAVEEANRTTKEMHAEGYEAVSVGIHSRFDHLDGCYRYALKVKYNIMHNEKPRLHEIGFVECCDSYEEAIEKLDELTCGYKDMDVCECTSIFDGTVISGVVLFRP